MRIRKRVHEILQPAAAGDVASRVFDFFILSTIAISVIAIILESVESIRRTGTGLFQWLEIVSVAIFTVEYLLRLWACVAEPKFRHPILGRARFALTPMALVDLAAILPFYLPFTGIDLRFIRAVRLLRLFRVVKIGRYSASLQLVGRVIRNKKEELGLMLFVLLLLLVLASCFLYTAEHDAQPEAFPDIPSAMWWAAATLTTVGYGDIYPITPVGKVLASVIAVLGIGMFALPTAILGAGFMEEIQAAKQKPRRCPHCGGVIIERRS